MGDNVQLNCHVGKGDTPMNITWTLNGRPIPAHMGVSILPIGTRTSLLTVGYVTADLAGEYECRAENRAGLSVHSTMLLVNGSSMIELCGLEL